MEPGGPGERLRRRAEQHRSARDGRHHVRPGPSVQDRLHPGMLHRRHRRLTTARGGVGARKHFESRIRIDAPQGVETKGAAMRTLRETLRDYPMEDDGRWYAFVIVPFVTLSLVLGILGQAINFQAMQLLARCCCQPGRAAIRRGRSRWQWQLTTACRFCAGAPSHPAPPARAA